MRSKNPFQTKAKLFFLVILLGFSAVSCSDDSNPDCADPSASNYNPDAIGYGDCEFSSVSIAPELIAVLDNTVRETSGLAFVSGRLITHNDRNNTNELFAIDTSNGNITNTFVLAGAENHDWEDLANNEHYLFVGDIGNNHGDRTDLKIYIVEKARFDFSRNQSTVIPKGVINYHYPEQIEFEPGSSHNWDAEGLIYLRGYLYIFMKHRTDQLGSLYRIPAEEGEHEAELLGKFNAGHRITGADISRDEKQIALVGYNKSGNCVLWLFENFSLDNPLSGSKRKIVLGTFAELGQIEAVVYESESSLLLSAEAVNGIPARLYRLQL